MSHASDTTVALVTGAASGIGAAIAQGLASTGTSVAIVDVDQKRGRAVAAEVSGMFVSADVSRPEENQRAVGTVLERFGRLDLAILNAGIGGEGNLTSELDLNGYRRLRAVNLDAVVYGIDAVRTPLAAQGQGQIVVTASLAGLFANPMDPLYAATKHAVVGLVRSLGPVLAPQGISINALCPAATDTPIWGDAVPHLEEVGIAVMDVSRAADTLDLIIAAGGTGQIWPVVPHEASAPFPFPSAPELRIVPGADTTKESS